MLAREGVRVEERENVREKAIKREGERKRKNRQIKSKSTRKRQRKRECA